MSVYNTEFHFVQRAIDSVLNQDFQNFQLLIIDDGSNNDTHNQILNYAVRHQDKISYVRHSNRGQAESINLGVLLAKGDFIAIIDSDDQYKPNHLSTCLKNIADLDLIASMTDTIVDSEDDFYVPDRFDQNKLIHIDNCILFATLFGRKEVFTDLKFRSGYAADSHFFETASKKYQVKKVNQRTYIYYRNMPNSICANIKKNILLKAA